MAPDLDCTRELLLSPEAQSCLGCGQRWKQLTWMDKMKVSWGGRRALNVTHSDLIGIEELGWF